MTKTYSTAFGHPLSKESKHFVSEVRLKLNQPIHPNFDTDFNIYRFVLAAERNHRKEKEIIEAAAKALNNHLRLRKALKLDAQKVLPLQENPLFQKKLMPLGEVLEYTDSSNRLLWYIEYESITVESIAYTIPSSHACKFQFWQFENLLRRVMSHEDKTGKLSSLRHVVDLEGYDLNPFTMLFLSSGTMAYYTQLFHFENYPELVSPSEIVNIPGWAHMPYKLVRGMMPAGFTDRFRLHDKKFLDTLKEEIDVKHIPVSLGGENKDIRCIPAEKVEPEKYWQPSNNDILSALETVAVPARKMRHMVVEARQGDTISWYYRSDGDVYFGVFYQPSDEKRHEKEFDTEALEMVYPMFKITAKLVHEQDQLKCERDGRYYMVFCNRHSWLSKRTADVVVAVTDTEGDRRRVHSDGTHAPCDLRI